MTESGNPITVAHDAMAGVLVAIATDISNTRVFTQRDFVRLWWQVMQTGLINTEEFVSSVGLAKKKLILVKQWGTYQESNRRPGQTNPLPQDEAQRRGYVWFALELCMSKLTTRSRKDSLHAVMLEREAEKAVDDYVAEEQFGASSAKDAVLHLPSDLGEEGAKKKCMPDGMPWDTEIPLDIFTTRARNALLNAHLLTCEDLVRSNMKTIAASGNCGRKSQREIADWMEGLGLEFGMLD